jgi:uridine kinase
MFDVRDDFVGCGGRAPESRSPRDRPATYGARVDDLGWLVDATPSSDRPVLVAVDGVDGSGKTTFAGALAAAYEEAGRPAVVVHLDDFLNPREVRYRLGRSSPEGFFRHTYDLEAFERLVLAPLRPEGDRRVLLRCFDHRADAAVSEPPVEVSVDAVVVVEGMFLHRDELAGSWDVSVFLRVPFEVSVRRLSERDGSSPDPAHVSIARYVEGQRIYLSACEPERRATPT